MIHAHVEVERSIKNVVWTRGGVDRKKPKRVIKISLLGFFIKYLSCKIRISGILENYHTNHSNHPNHSNHKSNLHNPVINRLLPSVIQASSCAGSFSCCPRILGTTI